MSHTGSYFLGTSSVLFGDQPASFTVVNDTTITATSPAETGPDDSNVTVTTPGGTSVVNGKDVFHYLAIAAPTTSVVLPSGGATLEGTTTLDAFASSSVGISSVQFEISGGSYSGSVIGTGTPSIFGYYTAWDTTTVPNGAYIVTSVATDVAAQSTTSASVTIIVANPVPTTSVVLPSYGASLKGTPILDSLATSSIGVASVQYEITGGPYVDYPVGLGTPSTYGYYLFWNTGTVPDGAYTLTSVVTDTDGVSANSAPVTIMVANPLPTTSVVLPANGTTIKGTALLDALASSSIGVASVQYEITGGAYTNTVVGTANPSIYGYYLFWNTTIVPNGTYTLSSVVSDNGANTTTSSLVTITVAN
jgi:hypothetical protein